MKVLTAGTLLGLALAAGFPFASVAREDRPLFYNIVPVFPGREDFAVSEILRQHREVGLDRFLLSLSFHPQTTPARDLVPVLCERFRKVRDGVAGSGVELGVLVQSTLGHGWNGKVPLTQEKWQHVVLFDGKESPRFCVLDPGFRGYVRECISSIAAERPSLLLIDDDVGIRVGECFCPLHLAEMSRDLGRSAAEIERALREEAPTGAVSVAVSRTLRRTIVDFAKTIREAVDAVDPSMRCGICACWGGYWENADIAHALAGTRTKPFMRVNNAAYGDQRPAHLVHDFAIASRVLYQCDGVAEAWDETDTFPQNYMSESAAMFHSHIALAMLSGLSGCKLWTSEFQQPVHTGSQSRYEARLRDFRGFYETLHALAPSIRWQGISGYVARPPEGYGGHPLHTLRGLHPGPWNTPIEAVYGLPLRYEGVETDGIFALRGEDVDVMTDAQVETVLSKKTIVDSFAARKLTTRGFASLLGVEATPGGDGFAFSGEVSSDGAVANRCHWDDSMSHLKPVSGDVEVLANFCRGDCFASPEVVAPSHTLFANRLGGRVAVLGWHLDLVDHKMFRPQRRRLFLSLIDKLNGSPLEMAVESGEQEFVRHGVLPDGREILAVTRLSLDTDDVLPLRLARTPKAVERLAPTGGWEGVSFRRKGALVVEIDVRVVCCEPVVLRLSF